MIYKKFFGWNFRETLTKSIVLIIKVLRKLESKISLDSQIPSKFSDLCAIDSNEEKKCGELFKWGLDNSRVKNIAISGPYGSGKSSFLRSFEKNYKEYKCLNISLASFNDDVGESNPSKNKIEKIIEENILQQIIYKESADKLPNSRIKRIKEMSFISYTIHFIFLLIWINVFYLLFKKPIWWNKVIDLKKIINLIGSETLKRLVYHIALVVLPIILLGGVFYFIYITVKNFGINKIVIKVLDNEIELGNNKETSVFYKYLDEIIYFFKRTKCDVVFFEDIDRFESINVDLFTKLRELNGLLNNSKDIKGDIKFVYAVKDDLFESGEEEKREDSHKLRTKFFDLIVPIIPVINYSNSKEILIEKLWKNYLEKKYKDELVPLQNDLKLLTKELVLSKASFEKQNSKNSNCKEKINNIEREIEKIEIQLLFDQNNLNNNENDLKKWIKKLALYIDDMRIINNITNEFIIYRENLNKVKSKEKLNDVKMIALIIYKNLGYVPVSCGIT